MQPPGFNAEEELGTDIVEKLRSGKGEKKRYFVLVRAKVPMKDQQAATLSWYQHKPEGTFFWRRYHKVARGNGAIPQPSRRESRKGVSPLCLHTRCASWTIS